MQTGRFYVYVMTNAHNKVLYIGVARDLEVRVRQHRTGSFKGFTQDYKLTKLIYFETYKTADEAADREKQLKSWHREWKLRLIKQSNPKMQDVSDTL